MCKSLPNRFCLFTHTVRDVIVCDFRKGIGSYGAGLVSLSSLAVATAKVILVTRQVVGVEVTSDFSMTAAATVDALVAERKRFFEAPAETATHGRDCRGGKANSRLYKTSPLELDFACVLERVGFLCTDLSRFLDPAWHDFMCIILSVLN